MKILFMGTPDYAVPSLQKLIDLKYDIIGVYTQPDKPRGRGKILSMPPIKELALEKNIPFYQPKSLKTDESYEEFKSLAPDLCIVIAYGQLIPQRFLDIPKFGSINAHASLLPKYRGAGPYQWALLEGEKETGVTTMFISAGMDEGDILLQEKMKIEEDETAGELHDRLSLMSAELLVKTIEDLEKGKLSPVSQASTGIKPSYAPMLSKKQSELDFTKNAQEVHNKIRGLTPWPSAHFVFSKKNVKVFSSAVCREKYASKPGEILSDEALIIACGDDTAIELREVQMAGKNKVSGADFLRGYRLKNGDTLI